MSDQTKSAKDNFAKAFEELADARINAAGIIRDLQGAATASLRREVLRASKKFGADDARTKMLKARFEANTRMQRSLEVEREVAGIQLVQPKANELVIQGRVADKNGRGVEGLVVTLADKDGKRVRTPVRTDTTGYFALRVSKAQLDTLARQYPKGGLVTIAPEKGAAIEEHHVSFTSEASRTLEVEMDRNIRPATKSATVFSRPTVRTAPTIKAPKK